MGVKTSRSWVKLIAWNSLILLILLSLIFTIGEVYFRYFVDTTDAFSINKISKRWEKRHYKNNNFNVRDNVPYRFKIEQGKRRITIIGDSFSNGHGIKNVDDRFGNLLRERLPNYEVHVITVNGANSKTELQVLHDLRQKGYEFDIILLAYCLNDIDYLLPELVSLNKSMGKFSANLNYLQKESYFLNTLSFRYFALNNPHFENYSGFVLNAYQEETWEKQKRILEAIRAFAWAEKKPLCVLTFPFLQETSDQYSFREVHQKLNQFWKSQKVPHLDLLERFAPHLGSKLTVNDYDAHPNEFAHQLTTDAIENFLFKKPE